MLRSIEFVPRAIKEIAVLWTYGALIVDIRLRRTLISGESIANVQER